MASALDTLSGASLVLALLSAAFFAANLILVPTFRPRRSGARETGAASLVSICVPARNEERDVEAAVSSLLAQQDEAFEVIVVDDRSSDGTRAILDRLAAGNPKLKVISAPEPPPGWLGKPHALHVATREAAGEWLLFVDADVRLHPETVTTIRALAIERRRDFVALMPHLELETPGEKVVLTFLGDAFLFLLPVFLANLPRPRFFSAGGGAFMFLSRSLYDRFGGHEALRQQVVDDIWLARLAKRVGGRVLCGVGVDLVRLRMYRGLREIFAGFSKNLYPGFGRSIPLLLLAGAFSVVQLLVAPSILLASLSGLQVSPTALGRAAAATAILLACRIGTDLRLRRNPIWAFTFPLEVVALIAMTANSAANYHLRGGVEWRGRVYRDPPRFP